MALTVATYEQILTILAQLAENYTNLFDVYYDMFYSDQPGDVIVKIYNENGEQVPVSLPNRAKDRAYILNGNGDPNGVKTADKGSIYQDLENGALYINIDGSPNGWSKVISRADLNQIIMQGPVHPEGAISAGKGTLFADTQRGVLYVKTTATGNIGWVSVSATFEDFASINLDNLSQEGEDHFATPTFLQKLSNVNATSEPRFANPSLSNLNPTGEAHFANPSLDNLNLTGEAHFANPALSNLNADGEAVLNAKEDIANKVTTLSGDSTDVEYPSAKATYDFAESVRADRADKDLSNLTSVGNSKLIGKPVYNIREFGSLTNNDGVYTDFSSTSFLMLPTQFIPGDDPWELALAITPNDVTSGYFYFQPENFYTINLYLDNGKAVLEIGDFSSVLATITSTTDILVGIQTMIKVEFTGTAYNFYVDDNLEGTYTSNYKQPTMFPMIGATNMAGQNSFDGYIDINNSYIKINNKLWWKGVTTQSKDTLVDESFCAVTLKPLLLQSNATLAPDATTTLDLSSYLPVDGYNYEVLIASSALTDTTAGHSSTLNISSDLTCYDMCIGRAVAVGGQAGALGNVVWLPVGRRRYVVLHNIGDATLTISSTQAHAFKRIGTKF